jgi:linoleate 10R-lipoxygenase
MEFFLRPENASIWAELQSIAQKGDDTELHAYVAEAHRLTSTQRNMRVATQATELEGKPIKPGNLIIMLLVSLQNVYPHSMPSVPIRL